MPPRYITTQALTMTKCGLGATEVNLRLTRAAVRVAWNKRVSWRNETNCVTARKPHKHDKLRNPMPNFTGPQPNTVKCKLLLAHRQNIRPSQAVLIIFLAGIVHNHVCIPHSTTSSTVFSCRGNTRSTESIRVHPTKVSYPDIRRIARVDER